MYGKDRLRDVIRASADKSSQEIAEAVQRALAKFVGHGPVLDDITFVVVKVLRDVQSGELTYTEAVREGMYRPVGQGDVDFAAIVGYLRGREYDGWYVLEQDTILTEEPREPGAPADVRTSVAALRELLS